MVKRLNIVSSQRRWKANQGNDRWSNWNTDKTPTEG